MFDRVFGTVVHGALRTWQRRIDRGRRRSAAELLALVRQGAKRQGLDPERLRRAMAALEPGLRAYSAGPWPRRKTIALEQDLTHTLVASDGFEVQLRARLDRVVHYARGVAVLDFKTVPPHAFQLRADEWQLRTYALAASSTPGFQSATVRLFIIDLRDDRDVPVAADAASLRRAHAELIACARGINSGAFGVDQGHADRPCWCCGFRLTCQKSLAPDPPRIAS